MKIESQLIAIPKTVYLLYKLMLIMLSDLGAIT